MVCFNPKRKDSKSIKEFSLKTRRYFSLMAEMKTICPKAGSTKSIAKATLNRFKSKQDF